MESHRGTFDALPPEDDPPEDQPDDCALCGDPDPSWWYSVQPLTDQRGRPISSSNLARWWGVCDDCHELIARKEVQSLVARVAAGPHPMRSEQVRDFANRAHLSG